MRFRDRAVEFEGKGRGFGRAGKSAYTNEFMITGDGSSLIFHLGACLCAGNGHGRFASRGLGVMADWHDIHGRKAGIQASAFTPAYAINMIERAT